MRDWGRTSERLPGRLKFCNRVMGGGLFQTLQLNVKLKFPTCSSNGHLASTFSETASTKCCEFRTQTMRKLPTLFTTQIITQPSTRIRLQLTNLKADEAVEKNPPGSSWHNLFLKNSHNPWNSWEDVFNLTHQGTPKSQTQSSEKWETGSHLSVTFQHCSVRGRILYNHLQSSLYNKVPD